MKIVFMGTPDFAVPSLHALTEAGYAVAAVVTQPDKPKGRGKTLLPTPVKEEAVMHDIPVYQPEKVRNNPEFLEILKEINPDIIVVAAYGQIIPKEILELPKFGCINIHASLLPKYRGAAPIQWAVIDGCEYSGVTTMQMNEGLDTGDILLTKKVKLAPKETGGSLFDRLSEVGAELLVDTLKEAEAGTLKPQAQDGSQSTYVKMINKSFGEIDFNEPAEKIERLIRGLNPWPSAFTHHNGKMLKLWDADVCNDTDSSAKAGTVTQVDKDTFIIKCGNKSLKINELQLEGKKRMDSASFLRGNGIKTGEKLGIH